jgi:hypothetical protein
MQCLCESLRAGERQCPSILERNGHAHRCHFPEHPPGQHFAHCEARSCLASLAAALTDLRGPEVLRNVFPVMLMYQWDDAQALEPTRLLEVQWLPPTTAAQA